MPGAIDVAAGATEQTLSQSNIYDEHHFRPSLAKIARALGSECITDNLSTTSLVSLALLWFPYTLVC